MAAKVRYLLNRGGRYFARLVIPKPLRPYLDNKTELRTPLGPDRMRALTLLPAAVADLQNTLRYGDEVRDPGEAFAGIDAKPTLLGILLRRAMWDRSR